MKRNLRTIFLIIFLLFTALSSLSGLSSLMVVLILIGLLVFLSTRNRRSQDDYERYDGQLTRDRPAQTEPVYRHALDAVRRAGRDPDSLQLLPVDIGVLGFQQGRQQPDVYRTWSLPDDLDYIQPFAQLRLPMAAHGRVRFELLDSAGQQIFVHEDIFNLERGRNFITPSARLPIHDQHEMAGAWHLKISADGLLLADHHFYFENATTSDVRQHIGEDGELTAEMRAVLAETQLQDLSLDELLAAQDDEVSQARRY